MPWKEVKPMDEKVLFVADYLRGEARFTALCERYGISRKTGYKWVERYRQEGTEGLHERSRRPKSLSSVTPYALQEAVLKLRTKGRESPGPKKIQALLAQRFEAALVPSKTTIYNILRRAGEIEPRRRVRRVSPGGPGLKPASQPNELWSADYKGQFKTRDGHWCFPLTIMDHTSRYLLACRGLDGTGHQEAKVAFEVVFREYGLPARIRTDNGVPFATLGTAGLSTLSIWWIRLGIVPERIAPGRPQQNGRHERMHRTLKRDVGRLPATGLAAQQIELEAFRRHYNEERPHEALQQQSPSACYRASDRAYPKRLPDMEYPAYFHRHRVSHNGVVYWRKLRIYIGYLLTGEEVGMEAIGDGLWEVSFGPVRLGRFDERDVRGPQADYLSLKV